MKNLIYALAFLSSIFIMSCGSDDDLMVTEQQIVGEWDLQSLDYNGTSSTTTAGVTLSTTFTGEAKDIEFTVTFNESPQTASSIGNYDIELVSVTGGVSMTETVSAADDFVFEGDWTLDGNMLTVGDDMQSATYEITDISDSRMVLLLDSEEREEVFGIIVEVELNGEAVLTK